MAEPVPKNEGIVVPEALINFIEKCDPTLLKPDMKEFLILLIEERNRFGMEKYGQPLRTQDGRRDLRDALDELGDLLQYLMKARLNGHNLQGILDIIPFLILLCDTPTPKTPKKTNSANLRCYLHKKK